MQGFEQICHEASLCKGKKLLAAERKKKHKKELNQNQVKEFWKRKVKQEIAAGDWDWMGRPVKQMQLHDKTTPVANLAPSKSKSAYLTTIDQVVQNYWFWNLREVVKELQQGVNGHQFGLLHSGMLTKWTDHTNLCWSDNTKEKVKYMKEKESKDAPHLTFKKLGCPQVLDCYPNACEDIKTYLNKLQLSGVPITYGVAHAAILGFLKSCAPEAFQGGLFKCCSCFVQQLLDTELNWSYHSATQKAQNTPNNWEELCTDMAMRLAWLIKQHNVPMPLVLNDHQTGIVYMSTGLQTWAEKGSKQVLVVGKDKKHQFTLMPTVTASGAVLPFQVIYAGKSDKSLLLAHFWWQCELQGYLFMSGGVKHWSNLKCMKEVHITTSKSLHIPY
ncbi:hypothetical protein RhiTH_010404 [Rhizoctonia solani]